MDFGHPIVTRARKLLPCRPRKIDCEKEIEKLLAKTSKTLEYLRNV